MLARLMLQAQIFFTGLSWKEHRSWRARFYLVLVLNDFGSNGPGVSDLGFCPIIIIVIVGKRIILAVRQMCSMSFNVDHP